jgi:hypothetical protein
MGYSEEDQVFRPMSLAQDSLFWGLQFSYPQIFEHPDKGIVETASLPNATLFHKVRKWSRDATVPTPMNHNGTRENIPIRLGKQCFPWINRHPGLIAKRLSVMEII